MCTVIVHNYTVRAGYIAVLFLIIIKTVQVCGNCEAMTTSHENICCSEVDREVEKKEEGNSTAHRPYTTP